MRTDYVYMLEFRTKYIHRITGNDKIGSAWLKGVCVCTVLKRICTFVLEPP